MDHTSFDTVHATWVRNGNVHTGCINGYKFARIVRKTLGKRSNQKFAYIAHIGVIGWGNQMLPLGVFDTVRAAKQWVHGCCNKVNAQQLQYDLGAATLHIYRAEPAR